ncbi:MAG: peptidylprolyl isomerase [Ignavibacteriales bacterium]|nr:peptidylprolyl isomerase [Ignavibacteriales bacterium]
MTNRSLRFIEIFIFIFSFCTLSSSQSTMVDRIVAVVGKEPILLSDLNAQIELYVFTNRIDPNTPGLREQVLDALINEKLILAKAIEDTNVVVTDDEVNNELDAQIAQRVQQLGSEKKVEEAFGMPMARLKREYRDGMRKQIMSSKLWEMKKMNINASRREVEQFYAQYKDSLPKAQQEAELYHLFMIPKVSGSAKTALKQLAQKILDSISAGGDFASFASRYSDDPGTKPSGGDLGFVRRGEFFPEFEEAVFSLKDKELSQVVETPIGFHIIQLMERRGEQVHPRHILFKFKRDASEADSTISFLKTLKDSIVKGRNFSDFAKRHSEDKESGSLGGYLGRIPAAQLDKSIADVLKNMKDGDISDPFEYISDKARGYQIIYLKKLIPEHELNLTDDWIKLEQLATSYKRNSEYQKWIQELRSEIYWDVRINEN